MQQFFTMVFLSARRIKKNTAVFSEKRTDFIIKNGIQSAAAVLKLTI
jgi:hypothetical protein